MTPAPILELDNGVELPALGLGVFQTPSGETRDAVRSASGLGRSDVFLETKIWISDYGYDETLHGFEKSAGKLGVEQIDLLILHQALPSAFDRTLEAYRALETLLADGKVRAIGVSNFWSTTSPRCSTAPTSSPPSTRSRCTPTSSSRRFRPSAQSTGSSPRPGRRSAG